MAEIFRNTVASTLPAVQPELNLGPLELQTFGICFAAGFIAAAAVLARHFKEIGRPPDWSYEMIFAGLVGGVVGSRLDYLVQNWDDVSDDLLGNLFSGSGLVWFGGLVGGALAAFAMDKLAERRRGILLPVAACVVVGLIAAVAGVAVSGRNLS